MSSFLKSYKGTKYSLRVYKCFHIYDKWNQGFPKEFWAIKGNIISKRAFKLSFWVIISNQRKSFVLTNIWAKVYFGSTIEHRRRDESSYSLKFPCKPWSHHGNWRIILFRWLLIAFSHRLVDLLSNSSSIPATRYRAVLLQREVIRCTITEAHSDGCQLENLP